MKLGNGQRPSLLALRGLLLLILMTMGGPFYASSFALAQDQIQNRAATIDIVFDLDWTLIYPTNEKMAQIQPENVIRFQDQWYRLTDHTIQVLRRLHEEPRVRISFFSGGSRERNNTVVTEIYRRLNLEGSQFSPYLRLNIEDLHTQSQDQNLKFAQRHKKNLAPFFDLSKTILIDDMKDFAMPGQEKNLFWLGQTYNDRPRYELINLENPHQRKHTAPNQQEWQKERNKIKNLLEPLLAAISDQDQNPISFADSLRKALERKTIRCSRIHQ